MYRYILKSINFPLQYLQNNFYFMLTTMVGGKKISEHELIEYVSKI